VFGSVANAPVFQTISHVPASSRKVSAFAFAVYTIAYGIYIYKSTIKR